MVNRSVGNAVCGSNDGRVHSGGREFNFNFKLKTGSVGKKKKSEKKAKKADKKKRGEGLTRMSHTAGLLAGTLKKGDGTVLTPTRDLFDSIQDRRSHKRFKTTPIDPDQLKVLLEFAVLAPNHKMTEPWGFLVLGERTKRAYAETKARIKVGGHSEADVTAKAQKIVEDVMIIPTILAVTQKEDADPVRREEDYAAVFMAIQNLLLAATALGLGTKMHTGSILTDQWLREALEIKGDERVVAFIDIGEPAEEVPPKPRVAATEKTRWLD